MELDFASDSPDAATIREYFAELDRANRDGSLRISPELARRATAAFDRVSPLEPEDDAPTAESLADLAVSLWMGALGMAVLMPLVWALARL